MSADAARLVFYYRDEWPVFFPLRLTLQVRAIRQARLNRLRAARKEREQCKR